MKASEYLFEHQEDMVKDLEVLANMETPSLNKELLDKGARHIGRYFEDNIDCQVTIIENQSAGDNIMVRIGGSTSGKPIMLLGHYDTVFPENTTATRPFSLGSDGEMAMGPGVFDMKGGIVQMLWALKALQKHGTPGRPITVLITSDEEIGSHASRKLIEGKARESEVVLVLEPSLNGKLKTERKGAGGIDITIIGRASHAGLDPTRGASAVEEAARVVQFLKTLNDPGKGTTVNVGRLEGGTRRNVIPGEARMEVDFRIMKEEEGERIMDEMRRFRPADHRVKIKVAGGMNRPPMRKTDGTEKLFQLARKVGTELDRELEESSVGGGSDGNFCAAMGIPVLDGLGAVGDGAHSESEVIDVNEMPVRAAILERLLEEI